MRLFVEYEVVSGNDSANCEVLIKGKGDAQRLIHSKFKNFWEQDTETAEKGRLYGRLCGYPIVKITGYKEVPDIDWRVLKEYLTEI